MKKPEFEPQPEILNIARPSSQYSNFTENVLKTTQKSKKKFLQKSTHPTELLSFGSPVLSKEVNFFHSQLLKHTPLHVAYKSYGDCSGAGMATFCKRFL